MMPNEFTSLDAAMTFLSHVERHWCGASKRGCWPNRS
jgi:hypothetical protein